VEEDENAEKDMLDNSAKKRKCETGDLIQATAPVHKNEGKSLLWLQVNWGSIYNKALEFWNLVDTYPRDIIRGMESCLRKEIGNTEIFRAHLTTFSRDSMPRVRVKNNIACSELWVDEVFEIRKWR